MWQSLINLMFLVIVDCQVIDGVSGEGQDTPNNENNEVQYCTVLKNLFFVMIVFNM